MSDDIASRDVWVVGYGVAWEPLDWGKLVSDDGQHVTFDNGLHGPDAFWKRSFVCFFSSKEKAKEAYDAGGKIIHGDIPS